MQPIFSLLYTTVRANLIVPVMQDWIKKAAKPNDLEIVVTTDGPDVKCKAVMEELPKDSRIKWFVQDTPPFDCNRGWNLAAEKATGKIFIAISDDFLPPEKWDEKLLALEPKTWPDEDWAIHVEDGYVHNIMVLPIITRLRYERFGYLYYPAYSSMFNDTELTEVAYREGRVIDAKHLLFEHMHPDCGKRQRDNADLTHASKERWNHGETLFKFRKKHGFPVDTGPKAVAALPDAPKGPPPLRFCVYMQVTRDDLCMLEVCQRMIEEGVQDFFFSVPDEHWNGTPTTQEDIAGIHRVATQLCQGRANVECMTHRVKTYRFPGDIQIRVETRVRNDAMNFIRRKGFEHVCVVDSDELWKRGTLGYVKEILRRWSPNTIKCGMIPVVGFPGYPINGALDMATIYMNSATPFLECRTPVGDQFALQMSCVIHFTGTRRTMQETIRKHEESGHFDDPEYDFPEFLKAVLPNIRPGFKHKYPNGPEGVHFFKKQQIWPSVRDWMEDEVKDIPQSIWPYLGHLETAQTDRLAESLPGIVPQT